MPTSDVNREGDDPTISESWNKLKRYAETDEFVSYFREFSGVPVTKCKHFLFMGYQRGGFQLPHIHNVGPSTLVIMLYFSKSSSCNNSIDLFEEHLTPNTCKPVFICDSFISHK